MKWPGCERLGNPLRRPGGRLRRFVNRGSGYPKCGHGLLVCSGQPQPIFNPGRMASRFRIGQLRALQRILPDMRRARRNRIRKAFFLRHGRVRGAIGTRFRIGSSTVEPEDVAFILRREDARGLRDLKPFAAAAGVGGLTGLFAGFLIKAALSDDAHTGSESASWFIGGAFAGVLACWPSAETIPTHSGRRSGHMSNTERDPSCGGNDPARGAGNSHTLPAQ